MTPESAAAADENTRATRFSTSRGDRYPIPRYWLSKDAMLAASGVKPMPILEACGDSDCGWAAEQRPEGRH